jgi:hypothetical protein
MKKIFILPCALLLTLSSCTFQRDDVSQSVQYKDDLTHHRSAKHDNEKDTLKNKAILCRQQLIEDKLKQQANLNGYLIKQAKLNGYPEIEISTYFSMTPNNQRWLFDELNLDVSAYFNEKYYTSEEVVIPFAVNGENNGIPSSWTNFTYDDDSSGYISSSENNYHYYLDTMISPAEGSYIQYRILNSADLNVNHMLHYYSKRVRPIAVLYYKEKTMCGDYMGLGFRIFYKEY